MAIPFLPQVAPQYPANALVNLKPITDGIDAIGKAYTRQNQRNALASLDLSGVNPSLLAAAQTFDDPEKGLNVLAQGIMRKGDLDFEMAKLQKAKELDRQHAMAMLPIQYRQQAQLMELQFKKQQQVMAAQQAIETQRQQRMLEALGITGAPQQPTPTPAPMPEPIGMRPAQELQRAPGMMMAPQMQPQTPAAPTVVPTPAPAPQMTGPAPQVPGLPTPLSPDQKRAAAAAILGKNPRGLVDVLREGDPGTKKFAEASAKEEAETFKKLTDEAGKSRVTIATLDVLGRALNDPNVYTGPAGQTVLTLKRVADRMGIPTKGVPNTELALTVINRLTLGAAEQMKGALSDKDVAFLTTMVPSLASSKGGNAKIIGYLKKIEQRKVDTAQLASAYVRTKGRLDAGFQDVLRQFSDRNPLFPVSGLSPEQVKALPPGTEWVHPNGTIMVRQ